MITNSTEAEEREHLGRTLSQLRTALQAIEHKISAARQDIIEAKKYVWTNLSQLDPAERAANRVDISLTIDHGEKAVEKQRRLRKLLDAPYFGRVDFVADDSAEGEAYYIGVHSFSEEDSQQNLIYDWRSPIAGMFYDFQIGRAAYSAPTGEIAGKIHVKRQYKIKDGVMEYMLESDMNIRDEVLQQELSRTSDERMKHIAATIQKEQNAIIRNEHSHVLIIQGVAGSGKTSVALHRIAFLLYRYKGTLTSQNILILSPNKVFSDYISNVLPELGEENIMEMGYDELAARELKGICNFQTFNEQVAELAASAEEAVITRIRSKAGIDFVHELERFAAHVGETYFTPGDLSFDSVQVAKEEIQSAYRTAGKLPFTQRVAKTAAMIAGSVRDEYGQKLKPSAATKIKTAIKRMCRTQNLFAIYKDFYHYIGKPELLKLKKPKMLELSDVFPLVYLKLLLEGATGYHDIKHVVVDEMQDYTAVQYAVLSRLFPCKKTILGDSSQSVNPYSSSSITGIRQVFPEADTVELLKSYRSTLEIISFAQRINPNSKIMPIERHGAFPQIHKSESRDGEWAHMKQTIIDFLESEHRTLGIVCKTQAQAEILYAEIRDVHKDIYLLDFSSDTFPEGIIVTSSHMAKGLEFDRVLVPFSDAANYRTEMDRGLLYIACTRAMHMLTLTYSGEASPFLPEMA